MLSSLLICIATLAFAPATQPASQPATRPAVPGLAKYYNLMKIEFMKDETGAVVLTTNEAKNVLAKIRSQALQEKEEVDAEIEDLAADVRDSRAEADRIKQANTDKKAMDRAAQSDSQRTRSARPPSTYSQTARRIERNRMRRDEKSAENETRSTAADLQRLKARSAALAQVVAINNRTIPAKAFWRSLSVEEQQLLMRVGVTMPEFKSLLASVGHTEPSFLSAAQALEQGATSDQLVQRLRTHFESKLPAPKQRPVTAPPITTGAKPQVQRSR